MSLRTKSLMVRYSKDRIMWMVRVRESEEDMMKREETSSKKKKKRERRKTTVPVPVPVSLNSAFHYDKINIYQNIRATFQQAPVVQW